MYAYAGNNPVRYIDPTGCWIDNDDGSSTAQKNDTLWGKYGAEWKEKSGFTRDPRTLQIGETVGNAAQLRLSTTNSFLNKAVKSPKFQTFYINQNCDSALIGYGLPNTWETVGDALSAASFFLNCANAGCSLTGQFVAAEGCGSVAAGCDFGATICYYAGGCKDKAIISLIGAGLDLIPYAAYAMKPSLKPAYNIAAHRFINPGTGQFITNACGYKNYLAGPATGVIYNVSSNLYSNCKE